jgi:molecular chaperone GrpE (heat shock protein)
MIRQQAVVNEESNDSEFWKRKFLQLQQQQSMQVDQSNANPKLQTQLAQKASSLQDSHAACKLLTTQLQEQVTITDELKATFLRASADMSSYKKALAFRLNLA